eukprot:373805_1
MENLKDSKPNAEEAESSTFVNTGFQKWESGRRDWLNYSGVTSSPSAASSSSQHRCLPSSRKKKKGAVSLNVDKTIDLIVSNRWRIAVKGGQKEKEKATFDRPVPLPQMIDILVNLWEAEEK